MELVKELSVLDIELNNSITKLHKEFEEFKQDLNNQLQTKAELMHAEENRLVQDSLKSKQELFIKADKLLKAK